MTTTLTAIKPSFDGVQTSGPLSLFTTAEFRTGKVRPHLLPQTASLSMSPN